MDKKEAVPENQFGELRSRIFQTIAPLKPADEATQAPKDLLFKASRNEAGRQLPPYYLTYFLLVDFLEFQNLGRWEKTAFTIPLDFNGKAFLVEHRKFGLGLFSADPTADAEAAQQIVNLIRRAVRMARPYFEHLASQAANGSRLNVENHSRPLYERYEYLRGLHQQKAEAAELRKGERVVDERRDESGRLTSQTISFPATELRREARWLGISAVEAFFAWTEHVFIHLAIVQGRCSTGKEVNDLAAADWGQKLT